MGGRIIRAFTRLAKPCHGGDLLSIRETRWAGVGPDVRKWMMSANIGIDQIVREVMSKDDLSPEFLGGYLTGPKL